jgi:hypothetical protein
MNKTTLIQQIAFIESKINTNQELLNLQTEDKDILNDILEQLIIFKNRYSNNNSDSVVIEMSLTKYKQYEEFLNYIKFLDYQQKQENRKYLETLKQL